MQAVVSILTAPEKKGLTRANLDVVRRALEEIGGETSPVRWLDEEIAADIDVDGLSPEQAQACARRALGDAPFDVAATLRDGRRKVLLIADMDSTIITGETLDELAAHVGLKDEVARITEAAMNGELDFASALHQRVAMLEGLLTEALDDTWKTITFTPGAEVAIRTLNALGTRCLLVSGGFRYFTSRVAERCCFARDVSNELEVIDGRLTGKVVGEIVDRNVKLNTLTQEAASLGVPLSACAAIGDGANDLPMIQAAGLGIAFHAKPTVAAAARTVIQHGDLTCLLYLQGVRRDEWAEA